MHKKCTNSACRKVFSLPLVDGKCPHCGKAYPRLASLAHPKALPAAPQAKATQRSLPAAAHRLSIDKLDLSVRAYNCLRRAGFLTAANILSVSADELRRVRNLGRKSREEILSALKARGFDCRHLEAADETATNLAAPAFRYLPAQAERVVLGSGKAVDIPPMLVNGCIVSLSRLILRWEELLISRGDPFACKVPMIKILREEMQPALGLPLRLKASLELVNQYLGSASLPARIAGETICLTDDPSSACFNILRSDGTIVLPPASQLGGGHG